MRPCHLAFALVLALAWIPGQSADGALRHWLSVGVWPLFVAVPMLGTRAVWPWLGLVAWSAASALWAPAGALWVALTQFGWVAAMVAGALDREVARESLAPWAALAGVLASTSAWWGDTGFFGNPDYLAAFLVGTIWFSLAGRWAWAALPQIAALAACASLGAWFALLVMASVWALERWRLKGAFVVLVVVVSGAALRPGTVDDHVEGRVHLARVTARVVARCPVRGARCRWVPPGIPRFIRAQLETFGPTPITRTMSRCTRSPRVAHWRFSACSFPSALRCGAAQSVRSSPVSSRWAA